MSATATQVMGITVTETPANIPGIQVAPTTSTTLIHSAFNQSGSISGVTQAAVFHQALTGDSATIDLRALVGSNSGAIDGNGLKVQALMLKAVRADGTTPNGNVITISVGAADGYELAGAAFSLALQPGQSFLWLGADSAPDIATGDQDLDLDGTGSADGVQVTVAMG